MLTDCTLGRTVFRARCDIPQAPMLKTQAVNVTWKRGFYAQVLPSHRARWFPKQPSNPHTAPLSSRPATPGCECLATLLKSKLPVHACCVLCFYSGTLLSLEVYSVFTEFKVLFQRRISSPPTAHKIPLSCAVIEWSFFDRPHTIFWPHTKTDQTDWGLRTYHPDAIQKSVRSASMRSVDTPVHTL